MKGIRITGLCLLAVLAVSAMAATSASAVTIPQVGRCVKVATGAGAYTGAQCLALETHKKGKYEWVPVSSSEKQTFDGTGGETTLKTTGHSTIKCIAANFAGEYTGPKTAGVTVEFQGCTNAKTEQCQSNPQNKSEIRTLPLEAELGFIKNEPTVVQVGLDLKPTAPLTQLVSYECGSVTESARLEGSVIGQIKPIDKMTTEANLVLAVRTTGAQLPEQFEGGPKDTLSTTFMSGTESTTAPSTLAIKAETGHNAAPLEIKAKGS
jgi:opacity protein-like surface antigen